VTIELYRIDDRLIHGQVVVRWGQPLDIGFIVLVAVYAPCALMYAAFWAVLPTKPTTAPRPNRRSIPPITARLAGYSGSLLPETSRQLVWIPYASSLLDAIRDGSALAFGLFWELDARNSGALSQ